MKKLFGLLSTCFILIAIASCSNLNESSSLSLTFNGSDFARNSLARNISVSSEYEGYYIVASVLGDYRESKSLQISGSGTYTIEFDSVPVGLEIYVEANVYKPSGNDYLHAFTGKSQTQTVYAGENIINLSMKNLQLQNDTTSEEISSSMEYETDPSTYNGDMIWTCFTMHFYSNNKYQIKTSDKIISEGIYTGIPESGNTVIFKECAYKNISSAEETNGGIDLTFGNTVIVENPQSSSVYMGDDSRYFNFRTGSNICIVFKEEV